MPTDQYIFRGTYDKTEVDRIQALLDEQRDQFNTEDSKQNTTQQKVKKYGIIVLGSAVALLILNKLLK